MATMAFRHVIPHIYEKHAFQKGGHIPNAVKSYSVGGRIGNSAEGMTKYGLVGGMLGGWWGALGGALLGGVSGGLKKTQEEKAKEEHENALKSAEASTPQNVGLDPMSQGAVLSSHGIGENSLSPYGNQSNQNAATTTPQAPPANNVDSYKTEEDASPPQAPQQAQTQPTQMSHGGHAENGLGQIALNVATHNPHIQNHIGELPAQAVNAYEKISDIKNKALAAGVSPYASMADYASQMSLMKLLEKKDGEEKEDRDWASTLALAAIALGGGAYASYKKKQHKKSPVPKAEETKNALDPAQDESLNESGLIKNPSGLQIIPNSNGSLEKPNNEMSINNLLQKRN